MSVKLFDTHAHYNDKRFEEFEGGSEAALRLSEDAGVIGFINCGTDAASSERSIAIAQKYDNAYASVGLHPQDAMDHREHIDDELEKITALLSHPKVIALGEIGLDYHWDIDKDLQHEVFERQLQTAIKINKPVIIHDREAHGKTFDMIKAHPELRGVMHGFSASAEMAVEYVKMGWYIAFGGPVTYKNARSVKEACSAVPLERILIETDCPYLPPVPHRGEINYSAYMRYTLAAMAEIRGEREEALASAMIENTERLFGVKLI